MNRELLTEIALLIVCIIIIGTMIFGTSGLQSIVTGIFQGGLNAISGGITWPTI